jgi:hypothetical protein
MIFWIQKGPSKGNQGRLFCARLDVPAGETAGNHSDKCVVLDLLPDPIDLAFDSAANALYNGPRRPALWEHDESD